MDIFNVQSLITKKRIVTANDIDPTSSYLQVGVYQPGNKPSNSGNADAYPSYAIPISELSTKSLKNLIVVDGTYGDDTTAFAAGIYDFNKPFATIDAAVASASPEDTLWVLGAYRLDYYITNSSILDKGLTIYAWNCRLIFSEALESSSPTTVLTIKGNATIFLEDTINATIDTSYSDYVNINIECANFIGAGLNTATPIVLNSVDPDIPCYFTLKADYMTYNSGIFFLAAHNFNVNIDVTTLERQATFLGIPTGDFWFTNLNGLSNVYSVSRLNFNRAELFQEEGTNLINVSNGRYNTVHLTGDIFSKILIPVPLPGVTNPTAIVLMDASQSYMYIDANLNLSSVGALVSRSFPPKISIKGSIVHSTLGTSPFSSTIYLDKGQVKLYAEIYATSRNIIYFAASSLPTATSIDINNCKLVQSSGVVFTNTGSPTIRLYNATFIITSGSAVSASSTVPLAVEIYSLYANKAMDVVNISQALTAGTVEGEMVDPAMTAIGW
jgi:hypothetical protein